MSIELWTRGEREEIRKDSLLLAVSGGTGIASGKSSNNTSHDCTAVGGGHVRLRDHMPPAFSFHFKAFMQESVLHLQLRTYHNS